MPNTLTPCTDCRDPRFPVIEDAANSDALVLRSLQLGDQLLAFIASPENHDITGEMVALRPALRRNLQEAAPDQLHSNRSNNPPQHPATRVALRYLANKCNEK